MDFHGFEDTDTSALTNQKLSLAAQGSARELREGEPLRTRVRGVTVPIEHGHVIGVTEYNTRNDSESLIWRRKSYYLLCLLLPIITYLSRCRDMDSLMQRGAI